MKIKTKIIAEIGNNHNSKFELACRIVEKAIEVNSDLVKFQIYSKDEFIHRKSTYYNEFKKERLSYTMFEKIFYKYNKFIKVIATPFDVPSANFLNSLPLEAIKIASGDIDNFLMFEEILKKKNNIIFSTGGASFKEIQSTFNFLKQNSKKVTPLHCIASYPAKLMDTNLGYIDYLKKKLKTEIGFSDHYEGITASCLAIQKKVVYLEKHFTINKSLPGGDNSISTDPEELAEIINFRDNYDKIFSVKKRIYSLNEKKTKNIIRRIFFSKNKTSANDKIDPKSLIFVRVNKIVSSDLTGKDYFKIKNEKIKKKIKPLERLKKNIYEKI